MKRSEAKEMLVLLKDMTQQGWQPMLCDTSVPCFDNEVMCGVPNGVGDVSEESMMLPKELLALQPEFIVKAKGDSMLGAGIESGDMLQVVADARVMDGDTVMALLDGDYTVKTYCEDDQGHPWLVPQNEAYDPICLDGYEQVKIVGVVKQVTKCAPRANFRTCRKMIDKAKMKGAETKMVLPERVAEAVRQVAPMVMLGRQWYAVYRVLADCKAVKEDDFGGFCEMVRRVVPEHGHLPCRDEMVRMAVQSFRRPVAMWDERNAPVKGKRFMDYVKIAETLVKLSKTLGF